MELSEDLFDFLSLEFGEAAQGTAAPAREEPTPVEEDFSGFDVDFMENKDMGDSPVPDAWEFDEDLAPPMTSQYAIEAPGGGAPKSTAPGGTGSARASARQPSSRLRSARGGGDHASDPSGGFDDGLPEDKRQKRLERNRESARQSRQRKKELLNVMEGQAAVLASRLETMRQAHFENADALLGACQSKYVSELSLSTSGAPVVTPERETFLAASVASIPQRFGADCQARRIARDYHFSQLEKCLLPVPVNFLIWLASVSPSLPPSAPAPSQPMTRTARSSSVDLSATAAAASGSGSGTPATPTALSPVWDKVGAELGLTVEQTDRFQTELRKVIEAPGALRDIERLKTLLSQLNAFRKSMNTQAANVQSVSVSLQGTLSPSQYVKLLSLSARAKAGSV